MKFKLLLALAFLFPLVLKAQTTDSIPKAYAHIIGTQLRVAFKIDKNGKPYRIILLNSHSPELDSEAVRIVRTMPAWKATQLNIINYQQYVLPITFQQGHITSQENVEDAPGMIADVQQDSLKGNIPAKFPDWVDYISQNLSYPSNLTHNNVFSGTVLITFLVDSAGKVSKVELTKSVRPAFDKEAMRVARKMAKKQWSPGKVNGKPSGYYIVIPFTFTFPGYSDAPPRYRYNRNDPNSIPFFRQ